MKVKRNRSGKKSNPALKVLLTLALVVGAAFGVAVVWHNAEQASAPAVSGREAQALPPEEPDPEPEVQDEEPQGVTLEPVGSYAQNTQEEEEEPEAAPVVYDGAVPASDRVDNSYFDDAIFFGDSISTGIPLYHIADNAAVVAMTGINPSTARDSQCIRQQDGSTVTMLQAAQQYGERAKVYIMLGGNGLWLDDAGFTRGYQEFIDAVREQYPDAIIYLQSITPVTTDVANYYSSVSNEKVIHFNELVLQLAKQNGIYYVNVFEALAGADGYLPGEATTDGMHLSPEYYAKWFEYLKTHTVEG